MHLSPDAKAVAALIANRIEESLTFMPHGPQSADIWMLDLTRDAIAARLTYRLDQLKGGVAWLPDRSRVAFGASDGSQGGGVYEKIVAGVQDPQLLFRSEGGKRPTSWSPDGRFVAFTQIDDRTLHRSIWVYPLFGDRKPRPLLESTFSHEQLAFSPDGHWIAYASDKGGAFDVYIRAFPNGDREWRISQRVGNIPQWRADGRELFYWAQASRALMAVPIMSASSLEPGEPVKLFDVPLLRGGGFGQYSVTPDGQRFLIIEPETAADRQTRQDQTPIQVVLNWAAALNRR
jgi:dipeptidyl aminopeptidase/acylaminoacyl peptidase